MRTGQFFGDLNYKITRDIYLGVGIKYQLTREFAFDNFATNVSGDNLRLGGQLGYNFQHVAKEEQIFSQRGLKLHKASPWAKAGSRLLLIKSV